MFCAEQEKLSCCNENIRYGCFKKLRCCIESKLKFNGANNCIPPSYLTVCFTNSWNEFIFIKRMKISRAESCDVIWRHHCLHKKLAILCILWLCNGPRLVRIALEVLVLWVFCSKTTFLSGEKLNWISKPAKFLNWDEKTYFFGH